MSHLKRHASLAVIAVMFVAVASPLLVSRKVSAYGVLQDRYIQMSSSAASDTGVEYTFGFDIATTDDVGGIVVEFCSNSPIIGDTCTAPVGFTLSGALLTVNSGVPTFTVNGSTTANKLIISNATPVSLSATDAVEFELAGITNPSGVGTFYARFITFPTQADAVAYDDTTPSTLDDTIDAGGVALSIASQITITAKVQERLTFCVYTSGYTPGNEVADNNCSGKSGSAVTLGDTNGVLSPTGPYVDKTARYSVTTNASSDVIIRLKGSTLETGTLDIAAIGAVAAASSAGSEQFGFCTHALAGTGLTAEAPYNHASCSTTTQTAGTGATGGNGSAQFAFDETNTDSTYGQSIATKEAGEYSTGELAFIGNIGNTTEAGIYTTTLALIATGTY